MNFYINIYLLVCLLSANGLPNSTRNKDDDMESFMNDIDFDDVKITENKEVEIDSEIDRHDLKLENFLPLSNYPPIKARNCMDIKRSLKLSKSQIYKIFPYDCCPHKPVKVFCDMDTDGGGWTVIQRRDDVPVHENFNRTWMQYALGFGNLKGEFWLGLDNINALTNQNLNEIRFDLEDFEGNRRYAKYSFFYVHDRFADYEVEVEGYSGNAGDSFANKANRMKFSTWDKDLDDWENSCALK